MNKKSLTVNLIKYKNCNTFKFLNILQIQRILQILIQNKNVIL